MVDEHVVNLLFKSIRNTSDKHRKSLQLFQFKSYAHCVFVKIDLLI